MAGNPGRRGPEHLHTYHPGEEEVLLERVIFAFRPALLIAFALATLFFGYQAVGVRPDASFEKMIPMEHPYIRAFMKHISDLGAAGTSVTVAVEHTTGDIFDPDYLDLLQQVFDMRFVPTDANGQPMQVSDDLFESMLKVVEIKMVRYPLTGQGSFAVFVPQVVDAARSMPFASSNCSRRRLLASRPRIGSATAPASLPSSTS